MNKIEHAFVKTSLWGDIREKISKIHKIEQKNSPEVFALLEEIENLIKTTTTTFNCTIDQLPNLEKIQKNMENLRAKLLEPISNKQESPVLSLEEVKKVPPVGIPNISDDCGLNSLIQLISGSRIANKVFKNIPELKELLSEYYTSQINGSTASQTLGKKLRNWIGENLDSADKKEWKKEGNDSSDRPIDIFSPLHLILEKAKFQYTIEQEIQKGDFLSEPTYHKNSLIELKLANGQRSFLKLLDNYFLDPLDNGNIKHVKFQKAPDAFVLTADRFTLQANGRKTKIQDAIEEIPSTFTLKPEYTKDDENVNYEITECIIHSGDLNGGHYTTVRKIGNTWYHINDSFVKEIKDPKPYLAQAYILYCEKTKAPATEIPTAPISPIVQEEKPTKDTPTCSKTLKFILTNVAATIGYIFLRIFGL